MHDSNWIRREQKDFENKLYNQADEIQNDESPPYTLHFTASQTTE